MLEYDKLGDKYREYVIQNQNVEYQMSVKSLPPVQAVHKWVGAQCTPRRLYGIPNDMNAVLKYAPGGIKYLDTRESGVFKWTGGCIWNGFLYGFPRTSNYLLKMSLDTENIEYVELQNKYMREHHYGGICTKEGVIYQPPRDSDHILVWDLKEEKERRIVLLQKPETKRFRYCGSIITPNGLAYFLPESGGRVIKLDTKTEKWDFIGEAIDAMVFDAKIGTDGCIYGYSAYCPGILKINRITDSVEMIHKEIKAGAYGTKLGVNGHMYSIPGDGDSVWDYNPLTDSVKCICKLSKALRAKYAGGATMRNGDIYAVPAQEQGLLQLKVSGCNSEIPEDIYQEYFLDCY